MVRELIVLTDFYSKANKLLKKDLAYRKTFETDKLDIEDYINEKGRVIKKYCTAIYEDRFYKLNHTYEYVKMLKEPIKVVGLIGKTKGYGKTNNKDKRVHTANISN